MEEKNIAYLDSVEKQVLHWKHRMEVSPEIILYICNSIPSRLNLHTWKYMNVTTTKKEEAMDLREKEVHERVGRRKGKAGDAIIISTNKTLF